MKGIILAGGSGTRLSPLTDTVNKHLLPVYNKPMIYYPLSVLMLGGIHEIMIISSPADIDRFKSLFGDGSEFGLKLVYRTQDEARGIPDAFIVAEDFIGNDDVALILGDNIFYGQGFTPLLRNAIKHHRHATVFGYRVKDPQRFGVVEFDDDQRVVSLDEKPEHPKSDFAVTGLYMYDSDAPKLAKTLKPSSRGELEITDLNKAYLKYGKLDVELLGRGFVWMDAGTNDSLFEANEFVKVTEQRQGFKIACLEEIAFYMGYMTRKNLYEKGKSMAKTDYGVYLMDIANREHTEQYWDGLQQNPMLEVAK